MKTDNLQKFFIFFVLCCFFVVDAEPTNVQRLGRANTVYRKPPYVALNVTKPGKTYRIVLGFLSNWDKARAFCNESGGELASLQAEDFDLFDSSGGGSVWGGDYVTGSYFWLGGYVNDSSKEATTTTPAPPASTSGTNDTSGTNRIIRSNGGNGGRKRRNWIWLSGESIPLNWKYWAIDQPDGLPYHNCLVLGYGQLRRDKKERKKSSLVTDDCKDLGDASQRTSLKGCICEVIEANATESTMNATASTATKLKANESTTTTESTGSKNMADVKIHPELIVVGFILISYSIVID